MVKALEIVGEDVRVQSPQGYFRDLNYMIENNHVGVARKYDTYNYIYVCTNLNNVR
jgi:hypothetical protein